MDGDYKSISVSASERTYARSQHSEETQDTRDTATSLPPVGNRFHHQALFDGLRQLLPLFRAEADVQLTLPGRLDQVCALRRAVTSAPAALIDGTPVIPEGLLQQRLGAEAILAYLLTQVTIEALRQCFKRQWSGRDLWGVAPELSAFGWFAPSPRLSKRLDDLLRAVNLSPLPVYLAKELYEHSLTQEERRTFGQYYTPMSVVRHLFDQAGYVVTNPAIIGPALDVATGCGVFLGEAARRQARALYDAGAPLDRVCQALGQHLQGYDVHPLAIIASKLYVFASIVEELDLHAAGVERTLRALRLDCVRCADTLVEALHEPHADPLPTWVFGNPPYGPCREGRHLQPFRSVLRGRANLYQLFLAAALARCSPGGRLAFLIPESLRAGRSFDRLRQRLATEATLIATTDFHARASLFEGVLQGVLILVCEKRTQVSASVTPLASLAPTSTVPITPTPMVTVAQAANEEDLPQVTPFLVPASLAQLDVAHQHILLKAGSSEAYQLLGKLWAFSSTCSAQTDQVRLDVHTGRLVWNRQKEFLRSGKKDEGNAREERDELESIDGSGHARSTDLEEAIRNPGLFDRSLIPVIYAPSVHRYAFSFPPTRNNQARRHLLYGRLDFTLQEYVTSGDVILIQRTTSRDQMHRIIATMLPATFMTEHPAYLIENHVNYVSGVFVEGIGRADSEDAPLGFALGLLNSRLVNFLFAALSGTTQVSAAELRLLPLLYPGPKEAARLTALVERRMRATGSIAQRLEWTIDRLVYSWYGLTDREQCLIDGFHMVRHTPAGKRVTEVMEGAATDGTSGTGETKTQAANLRHARA